MSLEQDFELVFTSGASAHLIIDPAEIQPLFPEASYLEIYDWIVYFSNEVRDILDLQVDDVVPSEAYEYIRAAVACALSRIYNWIDGSEPSGFRLGDLQVDRSINQRQLDNVATASNWCELAALLRAELVGDNPRVNFRSVVRGDRLYNPMPDRSLRHVEYN